MLAVVSQWEVLGWKKPFWNSFPFDSTAGRQYVVFLRICSFRKHCQQEGLVAVCHVPGNLLLLPPLKHRDAPLSAVWQFILVLRVCDFNISLVSEVCSHYFLQTSCLTNTRAAFFPADNTVHICVKNEALVLRNWRITFNRYKWKKEKKSTA